MILLAALLCNYGRGFCLIDIGTEGDAPAVHVGRPKVKEADPDFSFAAAFNHLPACQFFPCIPLRKLQKTIQYPGTRSGSVQ
jgi:hypothetical protein